MKDISLKELLEAGCHFGHKVTRWHPKATDYIYQAREGIHIIDLAQTRSGLKKAAEFAYELGKSGKQFLVVATKRQAKGVVSQVVNRAGLPYLTNRWIGGFMTNWEEVKKNIDKMNKFRKESIDGSWNKFPKHEAVALTKYLRKLESVYAGVGDLTSVPEAIFIVDIKNEISALREALRRGMKTIAIVDTNVDPTPVDYPIPANDDAVGSIQCIVNYLVDAYIEGKKIWEKTVENKSTNQPVNQSQPKASIIGRWASVPDRPADETNKVITKQEKSESTEKTEKVLKVAEKKNPDELKTNEKAKKVKAKEENPSKKG